MQKNDESKKLDKDVWRRITERTLSILSGVPQGEGRLLQVDFKERTFEVIEGNVIRPNFNKQRKIR